MSIEGEVTATAVAQKRGRMEGLDALRFFAALSVVLTHTMFYTHERLDPSFPVWQVGTIQLFFTVSGLSTVLATRSIRDRRDGWAYFSMRRGVRLLPMYWIATTVKLATMILLPATVLHAEFDWGNIVLSYFVLPSRNVEGDIAPLLGVAWTLLYEVFFTVIFALAMLIRFKPVLVAGAALTVCAVLGLVLPDEISPWFVYFGPVLLFFVVGLIIGTYVIERSIAKLAIGLGFVVGVNVLIGLVASGPEQYDPEGVVRLIVVTALVLTVVLSDRWLAGRVPKILVFMGAASYSLYLFHPLIAPLIPTVLGRLGLDNGVISVALSIAVVVVAGGLIYRFIEKPLTAFLRARLPYITVPAPTAKDSAADNAR